jgi:hypothetical protein
MMYGIEMASCDIIHLPSFMKIGKGVQAILRWCNKNLRGCSVSTVTYLGLCDHRQRMDWILGLLTTLTHNS